MHSTVMGIYTLTALIQLLIKIPPLHYVFIILIKHNTLNIHVFKYFPLIVTVTEEMTVSFIRLGLYHHQTLLCKERIFFHYFLFEKVLFSVHR